VKAFSKGRFKRKRKSSQRKVGEEQKRKEGGSLKGEGGGVLTKVGLGRGGPSGQHQPRKRGFARGRERWDGGKKTVKDVAKNTTRRKGGLFSGGGLTGRKRGEKRLKKERGAQGGWLLDQKGKKNQC